MHVCTHVAYAREPLGISGCLSAVGVGALSSVITCIHEPYVGIVTRVTVASVL
jgi:hypothetical protein